MKTNLLSVAITLSLAVPALEGTEQKFEKTCENYSLKKLDIGLGDTTTKTRIKNLGSLLGHNIEINPANAVNPFGKLCHQIDLEKGELGAITFSMDGLAKTNVNPNDLDLRLFYNTNPNDANNDDCTDVSVKEGEKTCPLHIGVNEYFLGVIDRSQTNLVVVHLLSGAKVNVTVPYDSGTSDPPPVISYCTDNTGSSTACPPVYHDPLATPHLGVHTIHSQPVVPHIEPDIYIAPSHDPYIGPPYDPHEAMDPYGYDP